MHANEMVIDRFYRAFAQRDHAGMAACYAPDVIFRDPVFSLEGWRAAAMWRMLCERGKDLVVTHSQVEANDTTGTALWDARYTFSATGRPVHNVISASFSFADGLIASHLDAFDLHQWSAQALGLKGALLGWTPLVQNAIRRNASRALGDYIRKNGLAR